MCGWRGYKPSINKQAIFFFFFFLTRLQQKKEDTVSGMEVYFFATVQKSWVFRTLVKAGLAFFQGLGQIVPQFWSSVCKCTHGTPNVSSLLFWSALGILRRHCMHNPLPHDPLRFGEYVIEQRTSSEQGDDSIGPGVL